MEILSIKPLYQCSGGKRVFLSMHECVYTHEGKEGKYFFVTRGDTVVPHHEKRPDAVVIVATCGDLLVMTSEFRIPLGVRELGFPAGLIDAHDYANGATVQEAAERAAIREMEEETGLKLEVTDISPPNLYSSAGMTNESVTVVFGRATGTPSKAGLESAEDIDLRLISREEAAKILDKEDADLAHSKTAWPFLWAFACGLSW